LRRRFQVTVQNLFSIYRPVIDRWSIYDNGRHAPVVLAYGDASTMTVVSKDAFERMVAEFNLKL
jgi:predicted ABC-type ATPase